jgi:hypothetical protein
MNMTAREASERLLKVAEFWEKTLGHTICEGWIQDIKAVRMGATALEAQEPRFWNVNGNRITCPNPKCRNNAILLNGKLTPGKWMGRRPYCSHCGWRLNKPTTEQMEATPWEEQP